MVQDDAEAMDILKSILPEPIILRIQVGPTLRWPSPKPLIACA